MFCMQKDAQDTSVATDVTDPYNLRVVVGYPTFTNTALDMFGPLQIRLNRNTLKENQVMIFTCMIFTGSLRHMCLE